MSERPIGSGGEIARAGAARSVPQVDLDQVVLDRDLLSDIPIELMVRYSFIPLRRDADGSRR